MSGRLFWAPDLDCTGGRPCDIELQPDGATVVGFSRYCPAHDTERGQGQPDSAIAQVIWAHMRARNPNGQAKTGG